MLALDPPTFAEVQRLVEHERGTMPLPDALGRRLGVESWMLTFGRDGRLRAVTLLGDRVALPAPPPVPPPRPEPPPLERSIAVGAGRLAGLLGSNTATLRQLADLALRQDDPELRAEAARAAIEAMMRDPALERMLVDSLDRLDDATVVRALGGVAGDGAAGLLSLVAERARGRPIGVRAGRLLRQLGPGR